jgi:hypothetical protein
MTTYMTPADKLRACGEALYGTTWQSELARALGLSVESGVIRKMAAGTAGITARNWGKIADLMQAKRLRLVEMIPQAAPESGVALSIREALRDRPAVAAGCLIGLGYGDLGRELLTAGDEAEIAEARWKAVETRPATPEEIAENPFVSAFGVPVDGPAADRAFDEISAANARLSDLRSKACHIAEDLEGGYDGAPC